MSRLWCATWHALAVFGLAALGGLVAGIILCWLTERIGAKPTYALVVTLVFGLLVVTYYYECAR